jgi:2-aminoadipate transaminase
MISALERHMPSGARVHTPRGGLFAWLCLPGEISCDNLIRLAVEEGVSFTPGTYFFPDGSSGEECMRLNFVIQTPGKIEAGVKRLRKAIDRLWMPGG